jgi:hypothetical protein
VAPTTTVIGPYSSITVEAPGLVQIFPDNDPKNPRIGNYSADGQWIIPADIFLNTS